jgi:hypothetical protein
LDKRVKPTFFNKLCQRTFPAYSVTIEVTDRREKQDGKEENEVRLPRMWI